MKDNILKELLTEYDRLRDREKYALMQREAEVRERIPEITDIDNKMISLLASHSKELIKNPDSSSTMLKELEEQINELKERKTRILVKHGFDPEFLTMQYSCPECRDTGFVGYPVREKCKCLIQKIIDRTYGYPKDEEIIRENFDTFDLSIFPDKTLPEVNMTQRLYMDKVRQRLLSYQASYPDNQQKNILFTGKTGLGKTFLLNCLAKAILDKGGTVLKISSYNLFEQLFQARLSNYADADILKNRIFRVDTLIIDDLGTETKRNNFTAEDLFNILNERFLTGKHTFVSTNLTLKELKDWYSDRVTSRLFDVENTIIIRFLGDDIRLKSRHIG